MDKVSFFILNIFINSSLAFFTVVFLIEGVIFLFRIRQGRVAAMLRIIPLIKLPLDLCLYDFSKWSYAQGINPLNCEKGTRTLSILFGWIGDMTAWPFLPIHSGIQLTVPGNRTFTIADMIGYAINPLILKMFMLLFILLTFSFMIQRLFLYYHSFLTLNSLAKNSMPLHRKMQHSILSSYIRKHKVQILTSPHLKGSPFAVSLISSVVYIPSRLSQNLSQKEYEAVLAHEIEHTRYKDGLVRLALDFIGSLFWWIPKKWLLQRIKEGQEVGCDLKCKAYGIDEMHLASAICKSAHDSINPAPPIFADHFTKPAIVKRIYLLLESPSLRFKKIRFVFSCVAIGIAFLLIFPGKFWMF